MGVLFPVLLALTVLPVLTVLTVLPTNSQGFYRASWVSYNDASVREDAVGTGATACTPCGAGLLSELTNIDVKDGGDNTPPEDGSNITVSRVATSQQSCCEYAYSVGRAACCCVLHE